MKMTLEEIVTAVTKKEISAISIDTSIFDSKRRGLEWGVLRHMRQFKEGPATFVLPDIVTRELRRHLIRDAQDSLASLKKALREVSTPWKVDAVAIDAFFAQVHQDRTPDQLAQLRVEDYLDVTGAVLAAAGEFVDLTEAVDRYFGPLPPFGKKEAKKNEFPDALALLSLEGWCRKAGTKMLVVSSDGDWQAFAAESDLLVAHADLAEALSCFQEERARFACGEIARRVRDAGGLGMAAQLIDAVREAADFVDVDVDAESQFQVQPDISEVTFPEVHLDDLALEAVDYDGDYLVAQTQLAVLAEIRTYFQFSAQDSIDRDEMPLGSGRETTKKELLVDVLITFSGDLLRDPQIEQVEVLPVRTRVRYTELEPAWMNEPDDDEA